MIFNKTFASIVFAASLSHSLLGMTEMESSESYVAPSFSVGKQFNRKESTAYLECYDSRDFPHVNFSNRSFLIKPKEGPHKDQTVGKIGVKYNKDKNYVEIGVLEVESKYRRQGYGEAAVRTAIGIFRAPSNQKLSFDRFFLTVSKDENHQAARALYKKIGFKVTKDLEAIGYLYMELPRS